MKKYVQIILLTMLLCMPFLQGGCSEVSQSDVSGTEQAERHGYRRAVNKSARDIPVAYNVDVVVAGDGTSGGNKDKSQSDVVKGGVSIETLIEMAGNANDDKTRLGILEQLQQRPNLDEQLKADLDKVVASVDLWVNEWRLNYFGHDFYMTDFDYTIAGESPLYPIVCLYRARILLWQFIENDGEMFAKYKQSKREYFSTIHKYLTVANKAFGKNQIVRMYLGEPIAATKKYRTVNGAPEWASLQRENMERLADIVEWWIDNRMQADGQFGGGWGDDCEMWRAWVPVLIAFEDAKICRGQGRFSEAMMSQEHMKSGYTRRLWDVEHCAEDSADVITPMIHIEPENPRWKSRALRLAELMETLWTGRNERGFLQFKSTYFSAERVETDTRKACDTVYHFRAVQPALLYWQLTGDKKLAELFTSWMDTWGDAAMRSERGKPAGIIPSAIHWPDGRVGGVSDDWWDPQNHPSGPAGYRWPCTMSMATNTLLLTYHMTGREKYLEPIRAMAKIRLKYLKNPPEQGPKPGSEAWCALNEGFAKTVSQACAKYRFLTGNDEFDELFEKDASAYVRFRLSGDETKLVAELRKSAEALRVNFEGYTSEVRFTDRVFALHGHLFRFCPPGKEVAAALKSSPATELLYSMATGDPGSIGYFPLYAVRWVTRPRDIAAMVTKADKDRLTAKLFHFGQKQRQMSAKLYLLEPGNYVYAVCGSAKAENDIESGKEFTVAGPGTQIDFELPPKELCLLTVRKKSSQ